MAVITYIDTHFGEAHVENGVTQVAWAKIELLPKSRCNMRDMRLAVLAKIGAIVGDHGRSIVENPFLFHFVHWDNQRDPQFLRQRPHKVDRGTIRNGLRHFVPLHFLLSAEIGPVEDFLQANDLRSVFGSLSNEPDMLLNHGFLLSRQWLGSRYSIRRLNNRTSNHTGHS